MTVRRRHRNKRPHLPHLARLPRQTRHLQPVLAEPSRPSWASLFLVIAGMVGVGIIFYYASYALSGVTPLPDVVTANHGTPTDPAAVSGDVNGDGQVTITDLSIMAAHNGQAGSRSSGDVNGDGAVNIYDYAIIASQINR